MLPKVLRSELAAQGVHADTPRSAAGAAGGPLTLAARHDTAGGLVLGLFYDRAQLADEDAAALHSQCVRLLRALPEFRQAQASAGQLLDLLARAAVPRMAGPVPPAPHPALTVLRPWASARGRDLPATPPRVCRRAATSCRPRPPRPGENRGRAR